jgi:hypothetical protein
LLGRVGGGGGGGLHKDPVQLDAGPMLSPAWAGWKCFESEVEVEAAKGVPYRRSMLRAVQLSSEVYSSCGGEGLRCNVLYRQRSLNFQDLRRVKPLEILTSLRARIPPAAPAPYILPYTLLYICTVYEPCLRTIVEYRITFCYAAK